MWVQKNLLYLDNPQGRKGEKKHISGRNHLSLQFFELRPRRLPINWRLSWWAFPLYTFLVLKVQDILITEWRMFLLPDDTVGLSSVEPTQTDKYKFENTLYKLRSWGSAKDKVAQISQNRPKWLWLIWAIETALSDSLLTLLKFISLSIILTHILGRSTFLAHILLNITNMRYLSVQNVIALFRR